MDAHFFATLLASHYSKEGDELDTSLFVFQRWKGKTHAESQVRCATKRATKPGAR
jgi:hypothetical protein